MYWVIPKTFESPFMSSSLLIDCNVVFTFVEYCAMYIYEYKTIYQMDHQGRKWLRKNTVFLYQKYSRIEWSYYFFTSETIANTKQFENQGIKTKSSWESVVKVALQYLLTSLINLNNCIVNLGCRYNIIAVKINYL